MSRRRKQRASGPMTLRIRSRGVQRKVYKPVAAEALPDLLTLVGTCIGPRDSGKRMIFAIVPPDEQITRRRG